MKVILRLVNITVKELIRSLMAGSMKGNTWTEKDKVKGHTLFLVEISILENGRMGKEMVEKYKLMLTG
jgi:hypothetical protein